VVYQCPTVVILDDFILRHKEEVIVHEYELICMIADSQQLIDNVVVRRIASPMITLRTNDRTIINHQPGSVVGNDEYLAVLHVLEAFE